VARDSQTLRTISDRDGLAVVMLTDATVLNERPMKSLSRFADRTFLALQCGRSALFLAGGAPLLLLAGWLTYVLMDAGLFLIIPAMIGWKGSTLVLQALEPFAGKQPRSPERHGQSDFMRTKGPPQRGGPNDRPIRRSPRRPLRP
jgi:hypothetical protein